MAMTRNERLHRIVVKIIPALSAAVASGEWGPGGCPYVIETTKDGGRRVFVTDLTTGDRIGAVGPTLDDALAVLERKVGLAPEKAGA